MSPKEAASPPPHPPSSPLHRSPTAACAEGEQETRVKYKTELCRNWELASACEYGDRCQFAHGARELRALFRNVRYKTVFCRNFHAAENFCAYGMHCAFID